MASLLQRMPTLENISQYSTKINSYIPRITYNQHVHYERHLKYSPLRHLLLIPLVAWLIIYFTFPKIPSDVKLPVNVDAIEVVERFFFFGYLPHQLLARIHNPVLDFICAIPYTLHIFNPFFFVFCCFFLFKKRTTILPFLHCLGAINMLGVAIQYLFPTAPPWYFDKYGLSPASYAMKGDPAGLTRVDEMFDTEFYYNMFNQSTIVFGSFPSLHVGWATLICLFINSWDGWKKTKIFMRCYVALLSFAVVYLQHHYVVDVFGGLALAFVVKKIVPMPPLSTSIVITTTTTEAAAPRLDGGIPITTTTTKTMIPLQTFSPRYHNSAIMIPLEGTPRTTPHILSPHPTSPLLIPMSDSDEISTSTTISTQTLRSPHPTFTTHMNARYALFHNQPDDDDDRLVVRIDQVE